MARSPIITLIRRPPGTPALATFTVSPVPTKTRFKTHRSSKKTVRTNSRVSTLCVLYAVLTRAFHAAFTCFLAAARFSKRITRQCLAWESRVDGCGVEGTNAKDRSPCRPFEDGGRHRNESLCAGTPPGTNGVPCGWTRSAHGNCCRFGCRLEHHRHLWPRRNCQPVASPARPSSGRPANARR